MAVAVAEWTVPAQTLPRHLRSMRPRLPGLGFGMASVHEGPPPGVYEAELALAAAMPPARRAEFLIGRCALHRALRDAGIPSGPVLFEGRRPLLPPGVTGSISHCDGIAVAVAGKAADFGGLGIDLEFSGPPLEAAHLVLAPAERALLAEYAPGETAEGRLLEAYSAKEAAFKVLSPLMGGELPGLRAIALRSRGGGFVARPRARPELSVEVTVQPVPGGVLSWATLRP